MTEQHQRLADWSATYHQQFRLLQVLTSLRYVFYKVTSLGASKQWFVFCFFIIIKAYGIPSELFCCFYQKWGLVGGGNGRSFCESWMAASLFHVLLNSIYVISGRWQDDNERIYATETRLQMRFRLEGAGTWDRKISRPALHLLNYRGSSYRETVRALTDLNSTSCPCCQSSSFVSRKASQGNECKIADFVVLRLFMHSQLSLTSVHLASYTFVNSLQIQILVTFQHEIVHIDGW